ncbi:hypothetical protein [Marisediminicola senii]|uniref:hypothetical protein n=1 Tax=Marisediminicola senii TaxID=2711233 RepID=UPI0013EBC328|nr:hypothetical protein [Marisediminicola senii]
MPEAPRSRPDKHTVLHTYSARIVAAPDVVFRSLDARLQPPEGSYTAYLADPADLLIVTQGSWWYRAEYRVVPHGSAVQVEHVIVNVAQRGERAALVAGRRVVADAPLAFHDVIKALRAELERPAP